MQDQQNRSQHNQSQSGARQRPRRISGLVVIVIAVFVLIVFNYSPPVERVHCTEEVLNSKPDVIMLGTWWCQYCYQARRYFAENNVHYCEYDIEQSSEGEKLYNNANGRAIPVFLIDQYVISGFDETKLDRLLLRVRQAS